MWDVRKYYRFFESDKLLITKGKFFYGNVNIDGLRWFMYVKYGFFLLLFKFINIYDL